jgi:hypothetical protein
MVWIINDAARLRYNGAAQPACAVVVAGLLPDQLAKDEDKGRTVQFRLASFVLRYDWECPDAI